MLQTNGLTVDKTKTSEAKKRRAAEVLGRFGGKARAERMTPEERAASAAKAAAARWTPDKVSSEPHNVIRRMKRAGGGSK